MYEQDEIVVAQSGSNGNYLLHQFKKTNENRTDEIDILIVAKSSYSPTTSNVLLQIWNGTTLSWETLDTMALESADTLFGLHAKVAVNNSNYYDFGNQIAVRIYQLNNSGSTKILSVDLVKISFNTGYESKYSDTGDRYSEVYPATTTSEYTPKYPSNNPQDDL